MSDSGSGSESDEHAEADAEVVAELLGAVDALTDEDVSGEVGATRTPRRSASPWGGAMAADGLADVDLHTVWEEATFPGDSDIDAWPEAAARADDGGAHSAPPDPVMPTPRGRVPRGTRRRAPTGRTSAPARTVRRRVGSPRPAPPSPPSPPRSPLVLPPSPPLSPFTAAMMQGPPRTPPGVQRVMPVPGAPRRVPPVMPVPVMPVPVAEPVTLGAAPPAPPRAGTNGAFNYTWAPGHAFTGPGAAREVMANLARVTADSVGDGPLETSLAAPPIGLAADGSGSSTLFVAELGSVRVQPLVLQYATFASTRKQLHINPVCSAVGQLPAAAEGAVPLQWDVLEAAAHADEAASGARRVPGALALTSRGAPQLGVLTGQWAFTADTFPQWTFEPTPGRAVGLLSYPGVCGKEGRTFDATTETFGPERLVRGSLRAFGAPGPLPAADPWIALATYTYRMDTRATPEGTREMAANAPLVPLSYTLLVAPLPEPELFMHIPQGHVVSNREDPRKKINVHMCGPPYLFEPRGDVLWLHLPSVTATAGAARVAYATDEVGGIVCTWMATPPAQQPPASSRAHKATSAQQARASVLHRASRARARPAPPPVVSLAWVTHPLFPLLSSPFSVRSLAQDAIVGDGAPPAMYMARVAADATADHRPAISAAGWTVYTTSAARAAPTLNFAMWRGSFVQHAIYTPAGERVPPPRLYPASGKLPPPGAPVSGLAAFEPYFASTGEGTAAVAHAAPPPTVHAAVFVVDHRDLARTLASAGRLAPDEDVVLEDAAVWPIRVAGRTDDAPSAIAAFVILSRVDRHDAAGGCVPSGLVVGVWTPGAVWSEHAAAVLSDDAACACTYDGKTLRYRKLALPDDSISWTRVGAGGAAPPRTLAQRLVDSLSPRGGHACARMPATSTGLDLGWATDTDGGGSPMSTLADLLGATRFVWPPATLLTGAAGATPLPSCVGTLMLGDPAATPTGAGAHRWLTYLARVTASSAAFVRSAPATPYRPGPPATGAGYVRPARNKGDAASAFHARLWGRCSPTLQAAFTAALVAASARPVIERGRGAPAPQGVAWGGGSPPMAISLPALEPDGWGATEAVPEGADPWGAWEDVPVTPLMPAVVATLPPPPPPVVLTL